MKPFKQGDFSRYCSVYSTLNSLHALKIKLKSKQWQQLYDHLIYGINYFDALYEINTCGADHKRLEVIFQYANEWLERHCKQRLIIHRPFWNKQLNLAEFIDYAKAQQTIGKVVHIRIKSKVTDHYTVIRHIAKDKICFYDSSDLPDIPLKNIEISHSKKYQICLRQVYLLGLEAVQTKYTANAHKKKCAD